MSWFLLLVCACLSEILVQLIPAVEAFPVGCCAGLSFTTSVRFPGISVGEGVRHIHTLEHLQNITDARCKNVPFFSIQRVSPPQRYGDHVTVCAQCKVMGIPQTIYMLGRPEAPASSSFMCVQNGTQRAVVTLRVTPLPYEADGHRLTMACTYLRAARLYDRDMEPVMRFLRFFEKRVRWKGNSHAPSPHANLLWYRRMVLGLDARDSA